MISNDIHIIVEMEQTVEALIRNILIKPLRQSPHGSLSSRAARLTIALRCYRMIRLLLGRSAHHFPSPRAILLQQIVFLPQTALIAIRDSRCHRHPLRDHPKRSPYTILARGPSQYNHFQAHRRVTGKKHTYKANCLFRRHKPRLRPHTRMNTTFK